MGEVAPLGGSFTATSGSRVATCVVLSIDILDLLDV